MPRKSYENRVLDVRPDRLDLRDREYRPPLLSLPDTWPVGGWRRYAPAGPHTLCCQSAVGSKGGQVCTDRACLQF